MGYLDYAGLQYLWGKLKEKFAPKSHSHDDRYYTESEMDGKLNSKVNNNEAGANGLFSKLTTSWTATPTDDTYFIRQDTGGGNQFGRVKFSTLWNYIKGKADGTYQPKGNYAASNHSHTKDQVGLGNVDNTADRVKSVAVANFAKGTYINQYKTVNLTDLDQNTWYPVTGTGVPYNGLRHFKCNVQLNSGSKPSWSTHSSGFTAVVDILEESSGWGTTRMLGEVLINDQFFIADESKPPVGYQQMSYGSVPVWWLRGGGTYFLAADYDCTWTIQKSKYENSGQSVAPTTTYPGVNVNRATITANLEGNAKTATMANSANALSGLSSRSSQRWGVQTGTFVHGEDDSTGGSMAFRRDCPNGGQLSMVIDGRFYQNEGQYRVLDESDKNQFATAGHTHDMSMLTGNIINTEPATNNHKIVLGKSGLDKCEFYEYGGIWNFYKMSSGEPNLVASIQSDGIHATLKGTADAANSVDWSKVQNKPSSYPPASHTHAYLPTGGGTMSGNISFSDIGNTNTSNKISWNGSTDGADIYYQTTASDQGNLVINLRDDSNCYLRIAKNGAFKSYFSPDDGNFHGNVNGTADSATTSNGVKDYNDANRTIKIGFAGAGLTAENLTHIAGYTDNGTKIKDVSKDVLKSWIGLGNYLPLIGGTMSGQITKSTGGSWIGDRDRAAIKSSYAGDSSYGAVAAMATKNGCWTMGNLGGNESLIFNYSTDAKYNAGKNETSQVYLPAQAGTIITSATIGSQSVNYANRAGNADVANSVDWSKVQNKPSSYAPASHTHDDRYYTESEVNTKLANYQPKGNYAAASHTHNYAGSGTAGGSANSAVKLDSSAGSATQPVYFKDGKPVATTYALNKTVPADAKFTDTNTWRGIQNNLTSDSTDQSLSAAQGKALKTLVDGKAPASHKHTKSQITDFPTSMPASDVSAWAKAATKPSYTKAEVGLGNVDNTADKDKSVKYATSAGSATTGLNGVSTCIFDLSSNNGSCVRFYNGLQICFGNSSKSSGVVFKLPFANDNYAVVVGGSDTLKNAWYVAGSRTTTGFNPTQSGFAVLFHWIAIGNWK